MSHLYRAGQEDPRVEDIGGKAFNLGVLSGLNLPVPRWFAVKTSAFRVALRDAGLDKKVRELLEGAGDDASLKTALQTIREWISGVELPAALRGEIGDEYTRCFGDVEHVAVRSSAVDEDGGDQSFAGVHDSFLFRKGAESTVAAVKAVWASAYNERAIFYRKEHGLAIEDIAVAVVVQEMIPADVSGVMFTINPVTGNVKETVISSLFGAGEGLVSEGLDADTFTVKKDDRSTVRELADKREMMVLDVDRGHGIQRVATPDEKQRAPSLDEARLRALLAAGTTVESAYGVPQDIEFSFDAAGGLHLLQARPVTTAKEYGPAAGNHLIWDNSNIIESYSGVTSPMTFSFIRRAYTIVYNCFCEVMGVPGKVVKANQTTFSNMLGLFHGQVYYNLLNWYRLIRLFPGFSYNKGFMESMMGVKEPAELKHEYKAPGVLRKYLVELPRLLRLLVRSAMNFTRIRTLSRRFQVHFDGHYAVWSDMDFTKKKPHELMAIYQDMESRLLWNWKAPIINDFFVMIFYGVLKKLCQNWCGDAGGSLQNDLICGEGGIESTEPTKMLLKLATIAQGNEALREAILNESAEHLVEAVPADPRFAEFTAYMQEYLDLYGFRCMNELKLEEYSLRDKPQFVYTVIRNYLSLERPDALDVAAMAAREHSIRREAEKKAFDALDAGKWSGLRRLVFRWALKNARLGVKNRENMRFARTKIYGLLRELIRALGLTFAGEGILTDPEDVFYLSLDECFDYIQGTAITTDLAGLAVLRRKEFAGYRAPDADMPDDRFDTYGMAYHMNLYCDYAVPEQPAEPGKLRGIGCCPGDVRGPVKVLRTPSDDMRLSGEILVAERTDPGWVPLYPSVSGVLIERGSILSHSAIVAREMGIPTIVGIPGLISSLESGDEVKMDGAAGLVEILKDLPTDATE